MERVAALLLARRLGALSVNRNVVRVLWLLGDHVLERRPETFSAVYCLLLRSTDQTPYKPTRSCMEWKE
jgi:hypothetical protein